MLISGRSTHQVYRVIVLSGDGRDVLVSDSDQGVCFPCVTIPSCRRVACEVADGMKRQWGEEILSLFELGSEEQSAQHYFTARKCNPSQGPVEFFRWVPVSAPERSFAESDDYSALRTTLGRVSQGARDAWQGPFACLDWFEELRAWVEGTIASRSLHLTGNFRQFNASPSFSLIRFETDGPAVWFKAVGEPNEREFPITLTLARLFSDHSPEIVATRPEWNGWLMLESEGTGLDEATDPRCWEIAAAALANLQIESIHFLPEILRCGAHDLKLDVLPALVSPFIDVAAGLMKKQPKTPPPTLNEFEIHTLKERIQKALCALKQLGIPDSLGHLDFNPANLIVSGEKCVFLDWAEASVGHPFFTIQYLLEHYRRIFSDAVVEQRIISSYFAPWKKVLSCDQVAEAASLTPLLAAFAYAARTGPWTRPERLKEPETAAYLRSLVRRMNREAQTLNERRSLCLG